MFDQQPDHFGMAARSRLVKRGRVRMASDRIVSIGIFARFQQPSNDLDMTEVRRQRECQMALLTAGTGKQPAGILDAPQGRCHRQVDSSAATDQGHYRLKLAV